MNNQINTTTANCGRGALPLKIALITDENLYNLCKTYGERARLWRQKFIGLLPEVNHRCLYEKKGFSSIFEFAAKLCGLSADQVRLALNLEKRFEDKPALKRMFTNGEASINKFTRIVSIATSENEEELAEKIMVLPKRALDTWVRDEKHLQKTCELKNDSDSQKTCELKNNSDSQKTYELKNNGDSQKTYELKNNGDSQTQTYVSENAKGLCKPPFGAKSLPGQTLNFELSDDVKEELNKLYSKGINVNELLRKMLKQRLEKIAETKEKIAGTIHPATSCYIPAKIKKILKEEHGEKCSIATCKKPARVLHHTQRFALSQNHDPRFLAPLCEEHHVIAHSMDIKYHRERGEM